MNLRSVDPPRSFLVSVRRLFRRLPAEPYIRVIVSGPPEGVAVIQASLQAAEPRLSLERSVGMMSGEDNGVRVLMYWSLDAHLGTSL